MICSISFIKHIVMAKEKYEENKQDQSNDDAAVKPDPGTTNTTDPQKHMTGPLSSLMQGAEDSFDGEDDDNDSKKQ